MKRKIKMKRKIAKWVAAACAMLIAGSMNVGAIGIGGFNDYQENVGTYAYYLEPCVVIGGLSEEWYQNTIMIADNGSAAFYHKASYEKYAAEGIEKGGLLFKIGCSVNHDFQYLDEVTYIGFDEVEYMNYFAVKPTDYPAYAKDEAIRLEYDALWKQTDDVIKNIRIVNTAEPETPASENDLYQYAEADDFRVEIPKNWKWEDQDGLLFASAKEDGTEPWMIVKNLGSGLDAGEQVTAWINDIKETYHIRIASEPEVITYEPASGRKIAGIRSKISSEDGVRTYTLIDMVEYIGDDLYAYGCAYVSSTYDKNEHEDETTYFAFEHMMDSMSAKGSVLK